MDSLIDNKHDEGNSLYDCNICLTTARNSVISPCGHLFCWSCLHMWMLTPCERRKMCPVCGTSLSKGELIPLYGRNTVFRDESDVIAPRPSAQRIEPSPAYSPLTFNYIFGFPISIVVDDIPMDLIESLLHSTHRQALSFVVGLIILGFLMFLS